MWHCVGLVSEERIASIFRVEKSASEEPVRAGGCSINLAETEVLSEALSRECVFTEPLPSTDLFRVVVKTVLTLGEPTRLTGRYPTMDIHSDFTIPAFNRRIIIFIRKVAILIPGRHTDYPH
jgi:hypothetical protein